ncbi:SDR family NAD(P)-dependent oxidoreductase [Terriglobus sp. 2YAB30_2]|uniref:SDR family NAD(P)-dependent oxidoreductase n=1 Tax=Terriglobus sp. 2YAB30_2 TaxID=3233023 RepID=UPI003F9D51CF
MQPVRGNIVFITGASSGIGAATALTFAQQGARLLLCARRIQRLEAMREELLSAGAEAIHLFQLDVSDRAAVNQAIADLPDEWTAIDILVNNAGLARGMGKMYENNPDDWDEMIDTNVKGLLYVTRAIVPGMVARKRGHVVNIGSTASYNTYANGGVYCASKAAEKSISEGLKIDLLGTPVRVTTIDPGMVETEFSKVRFHGDEATAAKVYQNITPLTGEDIADAILWAVTRPAHVNIHTIVLTTIDQGNAYYFHRHTGAAAR